MASNSSKKVLIAEDEKPLARALSLKLNNEGIATDIVNDGEALREKIAHTDHGYSAILMDLMMPKHDGFAVIEDLKKRNDPTPVVIMSNLSQDSDRNKAALAGAVKYFVKSDIKLADVVVYLKSLLKL